jgi:outer membrane protein
MNIILRHRAKDGRSGFSIARFWIVAAVLLLVTGGGSAGAMENLIGEVQSQPDSVSGSTVGMEMLTLSQALSTAMSDNTNLQMAEQAVEIARASGRSALAAFNPDLSMMYTWTRLGGVSKVDIPGGGSISINTKDTFRLGFTWKYPLYNGGQDVATKKASEAGTQASMYRLDQAKLLVRVGVTTAFTYVLEAREALKASQASLDHLTEMLRVAQANFDAGYLPQSDLLSIKVAQAQAEQSLSEAKRNLELAQSGLALAIGADITRRWELASVQFPEKDVPYQLDTLWEWAIAERPELKELGSQRDGLLAQMDAVRSARHPRINFEGDYSKSAANPTLAGSGAGLGGGSTLSGTIAIWWDLYDFGSNKSMLAPMKEQMTLLDTQESSLKDQVRQEVESALLNVRTQLGNLTVMRKAVEQAQEAYRVARRRQEEGLGITLEVLNAEASLAQTSMGLVHIQFEYYRGLANLAQSVGMTTDDLIAILTASIEEADNQ